MIHLFRYTAVTLLLVVVSRPVLAEEKFGPDDPVAAIDRTGSSIAKFSTDAKADPDSLQRSWAWEAAWNLYIQSRLTEQNLRRFHDKGRQADDPSFDELTDQAKLRRDATTAMFDALVAAQQDAKIQWFIPALRPPPDVQLVPLPTASENQ